MDELQQLFAKAVDPDTVRQNPSNQMYTIPRTWGVYEVGSPKSGAAGEQFRKGNHPVRLTELMREFHHARTVALFCEEELAIKLKKALNEAAGRE